MKLNAEKSLDLQSLESMSVPGMKRPSQQELLYGEVDSKMARTSAPCETENHGCSCGLIDRLKSDQESLTKLEQKMEKQSANHAKALEALNNKVDRLIRLLSDKTEVESKTAKMLEKIAKTVEKKSDVKLDKHVAATSMGVFMKKMAKESENGESEEPQPMQPIERRVTNELDDYRWGFGTLLLGDGLFLRLNEVEDVKAQVDKMEKHLQFRIKAKEKETIGKMYDKARDKIVFAMPPKVNKIVLSVGFNDLFDDSLATLKDASLEEVKQKNRSKLKEKASQIKVKLECFASQSFSNSFHFCYRE